VAARNWQGWNKTMADMSDLQSDLKMAKAFNLSDFDNEAARNPFPTYRMLREHDPVHRNADGSYFLTRYDDVVQSFRHPAMSSDKKIAFKPRFGDGPLYTHHTTSLVFNDPPIHTRVRKLLAAAFTPRKLAELEPVVERVIDDLLDKLEAMGDFEIIEDYALALPTQVISDMLGVPEEQRHLLRGYSNLILGALDPVVAPAELRAGEGAVVEFEEMLNELIAKRRENPRGSQIGEVLAALIFGEVDGERLSPVELVQNCIFLLNAGHETTANLIGNSVDMLLQASDQLQRLQDDPELIRSAIEESLRYQSPLQIGNRKAMEDVVFGETTIPAGSFIAASPPPTAIRRSSTIRKMSIFRAILTDRSLLASANTFAWATLWGASRAGWRLENSSIAFLTSKEMAPVS
jgi:hypothetical protein